MLKLIFGTIMVAFLLAPLAAQAKERCRYCESGYGASPYGHGHAECRVRIPLPHGATKLAIQLQLNGRYLFQEPRVAIPKNGAVYIGCGIINPADTLIACFEWGIVQKTTTLHRPNGRIPLFGGKGNHTFEVPY